MSENVSVLTGNTQALVEQTVDAFNQIVLAHIYGDFDAHTEVKVYDVAYLEPTSHHIVASKTMRIKMNHPALGAVAFALPCEATSETVVTDGPPVFVGQPVPSQVVPAGQNAQFSVYVASTTSVRYQWQKNGADMGGETTKLLFLTAVTKANAAIYRCVATNSFGPTVSENGTLFVS